MQKVANGLYIRVLTVGIYPLMGVSPLKPSRTIRIFSSAENCHWVKEVKLKGGLDYKQVFEIDGEQLWFIDDVSHVTCLLPEDY
jgi:hypothetical protein